MTYTDDTGQDEYEESLDNLYDREFETHMANGWTQYNTLDQDEVRGIIREARDENARVQISVYDSNSGEMKRFFSNERGSPGINASYLLSEMGNKSPEAYIQSLSKQPLEIEWYVIDVHEKE